GIAAAAEPHGDVPRLAGLRGGAAEPHRVVAVAAGPAQTAPRGLGHDAGVVAVAQGEEHVAGHRPVHGDGRVVAVAHGQGEIAGDGEGGGEGVGVHGEEVGAVAVGQPQAATHVEGGRGGGGQGQAVVAAAFDDHQVAVHLDGPEDGSHLEVVVALP